MQWRLAPKGWAEGWWVRLAELKGLPLGEPELEAQAVLAQA